LAIITVQNQVPLVGTVKYQTSPDNKTMTQTVPASKDRKNGEVRTSKDVLQDSEMTVTISGKTKKATYDGARILFIAVHGQQDWKLEWH
jgi:hypothetical protein